jgi:serine-type D-Ala-D-Ala carboxypeptidase (penicillin-binding protein 5/6)
VSRRGAFRLAAVCVSIAAGLVACPPAIAGAPPSLGVRAAVLVEASTGQVLYGDNAGAELPIASTTKLMTALVTLQHARLSQVFAAPDADFAADDSQIGLQPGERMTVHDLLIAMMLPSADDAAWDLAYNVGHGSVGRFIAMMNAQARALGLAHTHYSTPDGLDTPGNYSTASDLVTLTRYLLRTEPFFRQIVALPSAEIRIGDDVETVTNLNTLVGSVPWVNGVKTGHTLDAGYVLVGSGTRDGMTLVSAVLDAPTEDARETDTLSLLQYGFANFELLTPLSAGERVVTRPVKGRPTLHAKLVAASTFTHVFPRTTAVRKLIRAPKQLIGPRRAGARVGSVTVLAGGTAVATVPLLLAKAIPAPPATGILGLGAGPFTLLVLALLLIGGGIVTMIARQEPDRSARVAGRRPR